MISDSDKPDETPAIAQQNDLFRKGVLCHNIPGRIVTTRLLVNSCCFQVYSINNFPTQTAEASKHFIALALTFRILRDKDDRALRRPVLVLASVVTGVGS